MALYLITGIGGFIGSSLARELLQRGEQVRGVDNFSTGKRENLAQILAQIDFREADILDLDAMKLACAGVDYVLHQAAIPSVPKSVLDPIGSNRANVDGTVNVLVAARDAKVKRVVYAASSSAYGDTPTLPKHERMTPDPISPYAVAKLASEHYMISFYRCYGLETVALRYFNIFGPRQDPSSPYSGVLAKFITLMLAGKQPTIFGDGEQSRDFTYIDNAVEANLLACKAPAGTSGRQSIQRGDWTASHAQRNLQAAAESHLVLRFPHLWRGTRRRHQALTGRHLRGGTASRLQTQSEFRRRPAANRRLVSEPDQGCRRLTLNL